MASIPKKVRERIESALKQFQPILQTAKDMDVNETDTVTIVKDILSGIYGYNKYTEVTSEFSIRGTYCDLAIKIDGNVKLLIEVKAVGVELKDSHIKQATDYAANQGLEWVGLTNGIIWKIFRMHFSQPISSEVVLDIDLLRCSHESDGDMEKLFLLAREEQMDHALREYQENRHAVSKYSIGAILQTDAVLTVVRRELRKLFEDIKIDVDDVQAVLLADVLKREVVEGEKTKDILKKVEKMYKKIEKERQQDVSKVVQDSPVFIKPGTGDPASS